MIDRSLAAVAAAGLGLVGYLLVALCTPAAMESVPPASRARAPEDDAGPRPQPHAGTGPHELRGTVIDAGSQPVVGAWVMAELEPGAGAEGGGPGSGSGSGSNRKGTQEAKAGSDSRAESESRSGAAATAGTDRVGAFTLRGLVAGRHRLRVSGAQILTAEVRFVDVPGPEMRIVASRRAEVRGLVTEHGRPVAGAAVHLLPLGGAAQLTQVTDESGRFAFDDLIEGRFRLWAARGERASPVWPVDRVGPGPFAQPELALVPAAVVVGRVVDSSSGRGVAAHVVLVADDPDEPPRTATSSAAGAFRIEGVPFGRWTADAFAPGYIGTDAVRFEAGTGQMASIALRRGGLLAGRVVDSRGMPVVGAAVIARAADGGLDVSALTVARRLGAGTLGQGWGASSTSTPVAGTVTSTGLRFIPRGELGVVVGPLPYPPAGGSAGGTLRIASPLGAATGDAPPLPVDPVLEPRFVTDGEGRFRVTGLAPGRYFVLASHPDFADGASAPRAVELDRAHPDIHVVLLPGLVLHGLVADDRGVPLAGATVEARGQPGGPDPRYAFTGRDGRYRLAPVATDVRLQVGTPRHGQVWRDVDVGRLGSERLVREENFTLVQADAAIVGRVTDASGFAVPGATVRVVTDGIDAPPAVTDAAGRFRLSGVVAGRHRVRIEGAGYPSAELEVATGTDSELRLSFGGGLEVDVTDRSSREGVAGADVIASGPGGARRRASAGRNGKVELSGLTAGSWTVEASAPGYAAASAKVEVTAGSRPGQLTAQVRIELGRGATLAGVVRDRNGERVTGAAVMAGSARTTSDAEGRFRLTDVASGAVTVEAEKQGARGQLDLELAPGDELVTLELRLE